MGRIHWIMLLGFVALSLPVFAHHGFQAEYNGDKIVYVTGSVTPWALQTVEEPAIGQGGISGRGIIAGTQTLSPQNCKTAFGV